MVHITAKHSSYDNHKSLQNLVQYPVAWQKSNQLDDTSVIRPKSSAQVRVHLPLSMWNIAGRTLKYSYITNKLYV